MTLQETLRELLSRECPAVDIPRLIWEQANLLNSLVKSGHIQEGSACSRLRTAYKDIITRFKEYEMLEVRDACRALYAHQPPPKICLDTPPLRSNNESGVTGVSWNEQKQLWIAQIFINHRNIYLGSSKFLGVAIKLRLEGEIQYGIPSTRKTPISEEDS